MCDSERERERAWKIQSVPARCQTEMQNVVSRQSSNVQIGTGASDLLCHPVRPCVLLLNQRYSNSKVFAGQVSFWMVTTIETILREPNLKQLTR